MRAYLSKSAPKTAIKETVNRFSGEWSSTFVSLKLSRIASWMSITINVHVTPESDEDEKSGEKYEFQTVFELALQWCQKEFETRFETRCMKPILSESGNHR